MMTSPHTPTIKTITDSAVSASEPHSRSNSRAGRTFKAGWVTSLGEDEMSFMTQSELDVPAIGIEHTIESQDARDGKEKARYEHENTTSAETAFDEATP